MGRDIDDVASDATWNRDARHETATERLDRPDHTDHDAEVSPRVLSRRRAGSGVGFQKSVFTGELQRLASSSGRARS